MAEVSETHLSRFPKVTPQAWREAVEAGLRGKRIEDKLTTTTSDGMVIQPLYTDQIDAQEILPWSPGSWSPRETLVARDGLDLRSHMQRAVAFGVRGFHVTDRLEADEAELLGIAQELDLELHFAQAVDEEHALRRLHAGFRGGQVLLPGALTKNLARASETTKAGCTLQIASSTDEQGRGAGAALQVAICLSRGLAWLREAETVGLSLRDAAAQLEFQVALGTDIFLEVAKLRALRLGWSKLLVASGAAGTAKLHVQGSPRSWTVRDPWVNGLRGTTIAFAAAIGGADSVLLPPFDALLGAPAEDALRLARNTHAILAQETHLDQVQDPAAGSGYLESLTEDIAQGAWVLFQELERLGTRATPFIDDEIERTAAQDAEAIATRRQGLVGVSEFPNLDEVLPVRSGQTIKRAGATLAEPFEALRQRSDEHLNAHGQRPTAFLCNIGEQAEFRARASFATNLLAGGGIAVLDGDGFRSVEAALEAFDTAQAPIAVIASTDELYARHVSALASGLRSRGAFVVLAGKPAEREAEWNAAGVDHYIYLGCDALAALHLLQAKAGVRA